MKQKLLFFFLTAFLSLIGGSKLWGQTYEWSHDGKKNTLDGVTPAKVSGDVGTYTDYEISYGGVTYTSAVKMESATTITFTTNATANVTIGIALKNGVSYAATNDATVILDDKITSNSAISEATTGSKTEVGVDVTFSNIAAGTHTIKRGGTELGVFYIKVVEAQASINTVTLTSSLGTDLTNGEMSIVGTQKNFTVTVDATHNASNATYSYSGSKYIVGISAGVLTISAKADQTYGTETITVNVPEEGGYPAGSATLKVTYWTGDISDEYSEANVGRKWTFNHAWTNSELFYDHESTCGWYKNGNHFEYQRTDISSNAETAQVCDTYVEQMYGLKVKQDAARKIWMQSTDNTYYLAIQYGGTIVIPNVPSGKTVRVNAYSYSGGKMYFNGGDEKTVTAGSGNASDFTYTTSSTGNVEITTSSGETIYFNSIVIEGSSTGDETVQSAPYTWNFENGSTTWGNTAHQVSTVYSDWNYGGDTYYNTNTDTGQKGYVIDAIKGLRFEDIPYLGLDWGYGHLWMTGTYAKITIPNLQANQVVTFVMEGREGELATRTPSIVSATNTDKSSSISIPRTDENWTNYDFKVYANGSATFTFTHAVSIRKIIIRKAAPTLVWTKTSSETLTPSSIEYGHGITVTNTATASVTDGGTVPAVKYRSGNTEIATVDNAGKVTPKSAGTVNIYAYTEAGDYATKEISYSLTITEGPADFTFVPQKGKVGVGRWIIPRLRFPSIAASAVTTLKVSKVEIMDGDNVTDTYDDDTEIASYFTGSPGFTIENYADLKNSWETNAETPVGVHKVNVKFTGVTEGTKARVTVLFESNGFVDATTKYTIEVTAADALNFEWENGEAINVYENTYIPIPRISGNASGNNSYSNGPENASNHHAYYYVVNNKVPTWNKENYKLNEGVPNYFVTSEGGEAMIFFGHSDNNAYPDTLLVYAKKAGDVKLHAKDSQTGVECEPITIHIIAKSVLDAAHTAELNTISFPYTWDFTKDISEESAFTTFTNSLFWENDGNNRYTNTAAWLNQDWAEVYAGTDRYAVNFMGGSAEGSPMVLFKGLQIQLGNSTFASKIARLRVSPNAGEGQPHLYINGGPHTITLPRPGYTNPNTGFQEPENYQLIFKLKTGDRTEVNVNVNGSNTAYKSFEEKGVAPNITANSDVIIRQNIARGQTVTLGIGNADVYWIAMSTEEKTLNYPKTISYGGKNITTGVTYAANTYSYNEDLDIVKSDEANDVTAYYASSFTIDQDAAASSTGEGTQYAVKMTPANSLEYVKANTGLLLKKEASGIAAQEVSCYMIANPRNIESYSATEKIDGETVKNFLVATGKDGATVTGWGDEYTEFLMAYAYKYYLDLSDPSSAQGDYRFDRDWSFYPAMGSVTVPAQRAFLRIPQSLYVDKNGNIVEMPSGSRSHRSGMAAEAPATKAMLSIIFDDEQHGDDSGETTGINTVSEKNIDSDAWFTLQGVRVNAPAKGGIYIHKGRKVVVK